VKVFVDTSALLALLDEDDRVHAAAASSYAYLLDAAELVTHNYVHGEAAELVRRRLGADAAIRLVDGLLPSIAVHWVDEATHAAAMEAWRARGAALSLVDQVSFLVMRRLGIRAALAFDRDFEAEGFGRPRLAGRLRKGLSEEPAPYEASGSLAEDIVSVAEISERSGRPISTVQSWRRRNESFPRPLIELAAGPIWRWPDVSAWIDAKARRRRQPREKRCETDHPLGLTPEIVP
jgi:predicted nucleic acid-binding protein